MQVFVDQLYCEKVLLNVRLFSMQLITLKLFTGIRHSFIFGVLIILCEICEDVKSNWLYIKPPNFMVQFVSTVKYQLFLARVCM